MDQKTFNEFMNYFSKNPQKYKKYEALWLSNLYLSRPIGQEKSATEIIKMLQKFPRHITNYFQLKEIILFYFGEKHWRNQKEACNTLSWRISKIKAHKNPKSGYNKEGFVYYKPKKN